MSNTHLLGIVQPHYLHKVKEKNSGKKGLNYVDSKIGPNMILSALFASFWLWTTTSSSAMAERLRDALYASVVSFNRAIL